MNKIIFRSCLLLTLCSTSFCAISFIEQYAKTSNSKFYCLFTCWTEKENLKLFKMFKKPNIRLIFPKTEQQIKHALVDDNKPTSFTYILDINCRQSENVLSIMYNSSDDFYFRRRYQWLILINGNSLEKLRNLKIRLDSNVTLAVAPSANFKRYELIEIHNPGYHIGGKQIFTKTGNWSLENGFNLKRSDFYEHRKNLSSITIRHATIAAEKPEQVDCETYLLDPRYRASDVSTHYSYIIFKILKDIHGFNDTSIYTTAWFGKTPEGNDGGMGKLLYEDKVDLTSTGSLELYPERKTYFEFPEPVLKLRLGYVFRNPTIYHALSNEFLRPFDNTTWTVLTSFIAVIAVLFKLTFWVECRFFKATTTLYSWIAATLIPVAIIFQQGTSIVPKRFFGRLILLTTLMLSLLIYNYYTSKIISIILNSPVDIIDDLSKLAHSDLEIGIQDVPYTRTWFLRHTEDENTQYIYKHKIFPPGAKELNAYTLAAGMEKVGKGGFAYHTIAYSAYDFASKNFDKNAICELQTVPMTPDYLQSVTVLKRKSQYTELFIIGFKRMREVGVLQRIMKTWVPQKPTCFGDARVFSVGIEQTFIAFLTLFVGVTISLLFLVLEIFWKKYDLDRFFLKKKESLRPRFERRFIVS